MINDWIYVLSVFGAFLFGIFAKKIFNFIFRNKDKKLS